MRTVPLHGAKAAGRVALVDDGDYELVMQHSWHLWIKNTSHRANGPYAATCIKRNGHWTTMLMHNMIAVQWTKVDHRNHDGLDNQRSNLRDGSGARNDYNRRPNVNSSSQYQGVCWNKKHTKWLARITINGRRQHLGYFTSEEDAARARDTATLKAWGDQAYLNFT